MAILILAANTAFADFPRLSYFLARDGFLPHQFSFRGDRLSYSTGIVVLGVVSALLVIVFPCGHSLAHPSVCRRGVHLVHVFATEHVHPLAHPPRARLAARHDHQTASAR